MGQIECVPNFSEGRRPEVVDAITDAIREEDEEIVSFPLLINPDRVRVMPVEEMFREVS